LWEIFTVIMRRFLPAVFAFLILVAAGRAEISFLENKPRKFAVTPAMLPSFPG
jgi:hypothetical protein